MESRPNHPAGPQRLHALDNLRALMMWLGIVLHVSVIHMAGDPVLPWRDEQRTRLADLLMAFIHAFRMPVFFILAGFFLALLLHSRGPAGAARHRVLRLGLPFVLFWPVLYAAGGVLAMVFVHRMVRGTWGLDWDLRPTGPTIPKGPSTMHMWFLWMLLWLSLATCALAAVRAPWLQRGIQIVGTVLQRLGCAWWGAAVLVLPLLWAGGHYPRGLLAPSGEFLPPLAEWVHNGLFFAFGLALYHHQWEMLALYRRNWARYAIAGVPLYMATGMLIEAHADGAWIALAYNLCAWLWSLAAVGLAMRLLNRRHKALAYLADSSYWVYLVHMPLTIGFGALLYTAPLPALVKLALNIAATTALCLASYQLFVRSTWVGVLLNGKRHPAAAPKDLLHATSS